MGTHISRVKSVDLDAWTDEQLQSVLKWGNARANIYWEAKLAPGHVPSESKIENFIRTKYESKRWVADGPIPDPSTLNVEGDDDVPLSLVKEKQAIERSTSQKSAAGGPSQIRRAPQPDLFADDNGPPRASSASAAISRPGPPPPKAEPAPPKQTKPAESLLGLDFFGTEAPPPNRPASAAPTPGTQSRPDLKQSILSLYASAPRPQPTQQPSHGPSGSFGGMQSAMGGMQAPMQQSPPAQKTSFGGMNDAFSGLSFSNPTSPGFQQAQPQQQNPSAFSNLGNISSHQIGPSQTSPRGNLSGGSFFDTKPAPQPTQPPAQPSRGFSSSSGFGAFDSAPSPAAPAVSSSSGLGDLFDFSTPASPPPPPKPSVVSPPPQQSVFNLSQPAAPPKPAVPAPMPAIGGGWGNDDAWGSNDAWSSAKSPNTTTSAAPPQPASGNFGWGSSGTSLASQSIVPGGGGTFNSSGSALPPKVSADEDFGGWSSAPAPAPAASSSNTQSKPAAGFGASEDLFSNVWG
jgi:stromal membrane-associated protein